jgi:hypothetical protein
VPFLIIAHAMRTVLLAIAHGRHVRVSFACNAHEPQA